MTYKYDFLVIGAGIAGMSYALKVAQAKKERFASSAKQRSMRPIRASRRVAWRR